MHHDEPASTEQQLPADVSNQPGTEEEALDSRYLEGDFSDVDPAILEKLAVYIARYSYDPVQHSPNDNPEIELAFQAGDYLYVFGEMDEVRGEGLCVFLWKVKGLSKISSMRKSVSSGLFDIASQTVKLIKLPKSVLTKMGFPSHCHALICFVFVPVDELLMSLKIAFHVGVRVIYRRERCT